MPLVRFNPYHEIDSFRRQFDRLFDDLAGLTSPGTSSWQPAVELHEAGDAFIVKAQLPGLDPKDLDIQVTRDTVVIKGESRSSKEEEDGGMHYSEFRYGSFARTLKLPIAVENNNVQADFTNGILTLTLPKVQEAINRAVKINLGAEEQPMIEPTS
ncbi:MAG: Hsp20/alpha crystallin family protein [Chroococcales cyanobacterium]